MKLPGASSDVAEIWVVQKRKFLCWSWYIIYSQSLISQFHFFLINIVSPSLWETSIQSKFDCRHELTSEFRPNIGMTIQKHTVCSIPYAAYRMQHTICFIPHYYQKKVHLCAWYDQVYLALLNVDGMTKVKKCEKIRIGGNEALTLQPCSLRSNDGRKSRNYISCKKRAFCRFS